MAGVQAYQEATLALVRAGRVTLDRDSRRLAPVFCLDTHSMDSRDAEVLIRLYTRGIVHFPAAGDYPRPVTEVEGAARAFVAAVFAFGGDIRGVDQCQTCAQWIAHLGAGPWGHIAPVLIPDTVPVHDAVPGRAAPSGA